MLPRRVEMTCLVADTAHTRKTKKKSAQNPKTAYSQVKTDVARQLEWVAVCVVGIPC